LAVLGIILLIAKGCDALTTIVPDAIFKFSTGGRSCYYAFYILGDEETFIIESFLLLITTSFGPKSAEIFLPSVSGRTLSSEAIAD
jgi:hypothetical protein